LTKQASRYILRLAARQVIDDNHLVPTLKKKIDSMRTDVAGAAGDKYKSHVYQCKGAAAA